MGANLTVNTGLEAVLAEDLARLAARFVGAGITAFGTAGPDDPTGPRRFERAARVARDAGLQVVIHAGQTGGPVDGPASVRAALDVLGATRISHGVHAIHDPELLARLAAEGIVCDVCPASNLALGWRGPRTTRLAWGTCQIHASAKVCSSTTPACANSLGSGPAV